MKGSNWDKIILLLVSVVVIGLSGLVLAKAMSFSERFGMKSIKPDDTLPETDTQVARIATSFVKTDRTWTTPQIGEPPKSVPLFVSVPIVESKGQLIDMLAPNQPPLRPPVSNAWLINNNLDYLNAGVLSQDPDNDGFTNQAEWDEKTDPRDPESHPPYADKLVMVSRQQEVYKLEFAARPDAERFQIRRLPTTKWPEPDNFYMRIGEVSEDKQFRLDSFEEKTARSSVGIEVDASVLHITFLPKQTQHQLVRRIPEEMPTYYAELEFLLEPGKTFYVKEGDAFNLALDPETKYRVTGVGEDSTTITYQIGTEPEQTVEIKKK